MPHAKGCTKLGEKETAGSSWANTVSIKSGLGVGVKIGTEIASLKLEVKAKAEASVGWDYSWSEGYNITWSSATKNPEGQDMVVFTAVPFDTYEYEIVSSPKDGVERAAGRAHHPEWIQNVNRDTPVRMTGRQDQFTDAPCARGCLT